MSRVQSMRSEVQRLMHAVPFRPFAMVLENGDRIVIGHPENIAFDPAATEGAEGWDEFYVISGKLRWFSTIHAISSIALLDRAQSV